MIKIYGVRISQLPERRNIMSALSQELLAAWRKRHKGTRDEAAARASLAGMLLLQFAGIREGIYYNEAGRPCYANGNVDFNITHTEKLVFCAIEDSETDTTTASCPELINTDPYPEKAVCAGNRKRLFQDQCRVGLDAESVGRLSNVRICPLAGRWFSVNEHDFFLSDPNDLNFLRVWTRKEAMVKWTGEGLSRLRYTDTVTAASIYGIRFCEYRVDDTVLTLCCHANAIPPQQIHMLTNSEVFDLL